MNVFNVLDETIRGTIRFVFGYLYTTVLLYWRPLVGPKRLYRRLSDPQTDQISPPTYLAVSILIAAPFFLETAATLGDKDGATASFFTAQARAVSRGELTGLGALIGGTIAGTIAISGLLRIAAALARLDGDRRDRFITAGEYKAGLLVLGIAAFAAVLEYLGSEVVADEWSVAAIFATAYFALMLPGFAAALDLGSGLLRTPRALASVRDWIGVWRTFVTRGPRRGLTRMVAVVKRRRVREPKIRLRLLGELRSFAWFTLGYGATILMILMAAGAVGAGAYTAGWLLDTGPPAPIRLFSVSCTVEGRKLRAGAVAWNRSKEPAAGWLPERLALDVRTKSGAAGTGWWRPERPAPGHDFLAPEQSIPLTGPLALPPGLRLAAARGEPLHCLARATDGVTS